MSCNNTTAPVNIKSSSQLCQDLCAYSFEYNPTSSCSAENMGDYIKITTDGPNNLSFNMIPMSVVDVRLYQPSLHSFNGDQADAELIIQHSTDIGGNVLVCRPIRESDDLGASNDFFAKFIPHVPLSIADGPASINVMNWSLNDIIPQGAAYYYYLGPFPYPPCTSNAGGNSIVVFDSNSAGNMTTTDMERLRSLITASEPLAIPQTPATDLLYNKSGATHPLGSSTDLYDIYMDCSPITGVGSPKGSEGGGSGGLGTGVQLPHSDDLGASFEKYAKSPTGIVMWIIIGFIIIYLFVRFIFPIIAGKLRRWVPGVSGSS